MTPPLDCCRWASWPGRLLFESPPCCHALHGLAHILHVPLDSACCNRLPVQLQSLFGWRPGTLLVLVGRMFSQKLLAHTICTVICGDIPVNGNVMHTHHVLSLTVQILRSALGTCSPRDTAFKMTPRPASSPWRESNLPSMRINTMQNPLLAHRFQTS